jgi:hypothetical protein
MLDLDKEDEGEPFPLNVVVTMELDRERSLLSFWVNGKRSGQPRPVAGLTRRGDSPTKDVQWVVHAPRRHTTISIVDDPQDLE